VEPPRDVCYGHFDMKINVQFDVTPEELRTFFGLPDVKSIQDEMLDRLRKQMSEGVEGLDPSKLMAPFLAPNLQSMEAAQRMLWQAFMHPGAGADKADKKG